MFDDIINTVGGMFMDNKAAKHTMYELQKANVIAENISDEKQNDAQRIIRESNFSTIGSTVIVMLALFYIKDAILPNTLFK